MCAIFIFKPYVMPTKEQLFNAVYNNWHSYGLVTKIGDKLDIVKKCPEEEVDPNEVWSLLERDSEFPRYLHLRHNTAGATTKENTHPFDVFYSDKRQVVFMHNGTMHEYKSKKMNQYNSMVDDDDGPSDTSNFCERVLTPILAGTDFGEGKGHFQNVMFKNILSKFWPSGNRGLLLSNDQEPLSIGEWKELEGENKEKFLASNNDYFTDVKRGPEAVRRAAAKSLAEQELRNKATATNNTSSKGATVVPLKDFQLNKKFVSPFDLSGTLKNILNDYHLWDRPTAINLGYATRDELEQMYHDKPVTMQVMDWIFTDYAQLYKEHLELDSKLTRQGEYLNKVHGTLRANNIDINALLANNQQAA
jgi:hypothetical protein